MSQPHETARGADAAAKSGGIELAAGTPVSAPHFPTAHRRLLVHGATVVAILAVIGVGQGFLWAAVAPGEQVKVYADGSYGALPTADFHPFVGLALFVLFGVVVGLVAGAAVWQARSVRGLGALLAVVIGSAVGAALAYWIGRAMATGVDPATVGATGHDQIVVQAARLSTPLVIAAQPAFAAIVYTFLAAWNGRPDLGRTGGGAGQPIATDHTPVLDSALDADPAPAPGPDADPALAPSQVTGPLPVTDPADETPRTDPSPAAG